MQFIVLSLVTKILITTEPRYLAERLNFRPLDAPDSRRVSAFDLQVAFFNTSIRQSAFVFCAAKLCVSNLRIFLLCLFLIIFFNCLN